MTINKSLAPGEHPGPQPTAAGPIAVPFTLDRWLRAAIRTTRPRQWPKNLLVFAAPLAAASAWLDFYEQFWEERLDALQALLDSDPAEDDR